jgi:peptidoglycan/xylan/chitin deacetylase (PgdA/CDA1 family)
MRDLEPYLRGEKSGRVVGITFDDGYQNNLTHALPVLLKNRFTATCYAVSEQIDGTNIWDQSIGVIQKPLMTLADWRCWRDAGMDVGAHTRTHADLTQITDEQAQGEIAGVKADLESKIDCEVHHFCYPYGRYESHHPAQVKNAGYLTATTTNRGRVHHDDDPFTLNRIMVARATHLSLFAAKVATSYEDRRG